MEPNRSDSRSNTKRSSQFWKVVILVISSALALRKKSDLRDAIHRGRYTGRADPSRKLASMHGSPQCGVQLGSMAVNTAGTQTVEKETWTVIALASTAFDSVLASLWW